MQGWGGWASQPAQTAGNQSSFCWDTAPAASTALVAAQAAVGQGWGAASQAWTPASPTAASGVAALSALLARQARTEQPAFEFTEDAAPAAHHQGRQTEYAATAPPLPASLAGGVVLRALPPPQQVQQQKHHHLQQQQKTSKPAMGSKPPHAPLPAASCSLSLERYLDFWQLLTRGTGQVQQLSALERSMLKMNDLKQILQISGYHVGSKTKAEVLDRLAGLTLFNPAPAYGEQRQPVTPVPEAALACLSWVQPSASVLAASQASTAFSCCQLPSVQVCLPAGVDQACAAGRAEATAVAVVAAAPAACPAVPSIQLQQEQLAQGSQAQRQPEDRPGSPVPGLDACQETIGSLIRDLAPADSDETLASPRAVQQHLQQLGDSAKSKDEQVQQAVGQGHWEQEEQGVISSEKLLQQQQQGAAPAPQPAAWLVKGVARLRAASQGSADAVAQPKQLLGRKVAFVCLEDFEQGDAVGIVDTLAAGVQEGQVVEYVGDMHAGCTPGCTEQHAHFFVRVRASRSTAPPARRTRRRLDLSIDLQAALRASSLEDLLSMDEGQLQDAWVLLEPRPAAEEEGKEGQAQCLAGAAAGTGNAAGSAQGMQLLVPPAPPALAPPAGQACGPGPWRTKRSAATSAAEEPPAKQQAADCAGLLPATQPGSRSAAESRLVWAQFAGTWWPGLLTAGQQPGGRGLLQVEMFVGQGMRLSLPAASVTDYSVGMEARTACLMQTELGRQAVQRAGSWSQGRDDSSSMQDH